MRPMHVPFLRAIAPEFSGRDGAPSPSAHFLSWSSGPKMRLFCDCFATIFQKANFKSRLISHLRKIRPQIVAFSWRLCAFVVGAGSAKATKNPPFSHPKQGEGRTSTDKPDQNQ